VGKWEKFLITGKKKKETKKIRKIGRATLINGKLVLLWFLSSRDLGLSGSLSRRTKVLLPGVIKRGNEANIKFSWSLTLLRLAQIKEEKAIPRCRNCTKLVVLKRGWWTGIQDIQDIQDNNGPED